MEGLLLIAFGIAVVSTANVSCEYVYKRTAEVAAALPAPAPAPDLHSREIPGMITLWRRAGVDQVPLWKQNICLYSLGIGLNMAAFAALEVRHGSPSHVYEDHSAGNQGRLPHSTFTGSLAPKCMWSLNDWITMLMHERLWRLTSRERATQHLDRVCTACR